MRSPGFYLDISSDDYHKGEGLSRSDLINLLRSPAHYKNPEEKDTKALIIGDAFHVYVLQPDLFPKRFMVLPMDHDGRKTAGKLRLEEAEALGQIPLKYDEFEDIKGMGDSLRMHPEVKRILEVGQPELSGYWYDPVFPDTLCKIRIDWLNTVENVLIDLKSSRDARQHYFQSAAFANGYDIQAGLYLYGTTQITKVEHTDFRFALVEKTKPYGVILYKAEPEFINEGLRKVNQALKIYHDCMETDSWPCYPTEMMRLDLPGWVKRKEMTQIIE